MLAPQMPPIIDTITAPIYKKSVFTDNLPSVKKSIITVMINE